jgi:Family of unknown function (DUF5994)
MTILLGPERTAPPPVECVLALDHKPAHGRFDGLWCPASWDVSEIATFAGALTAKIGLVGRITLNPGLWSGHPRMLELPDRQLRIDWFDAAPPDEVSVRRGYTRRLIIELRPPATPESALPPSPTMAVR